jgi:DNA-directed RNA polymerase sigma subunit (sigma70/sigma32)
MVGYEMGFDQATNVVQTLVYGFNNVLSLEAPKRGDGDDERWLGHTLSDSRYDTEAAALESVVDVDEEMEGVLTALFDGLTPREARVMRMLYFPTPEEREEAIAAGIQQNQQHEVTLQFVADKFGLTRERIRQLELSAVGKMATQSELVEQFRDLVRG